MIFLIGMTANKKIAYCTDQLRIIFRLDEKDGLILSLLLSLPARMFIGYRDKEQP